MRLPPWNPAPPSQRSRRGTVEFFIGYANPITDGDNVPSDADDATTAACKRLIALHDIGPHVD